MTSRTWNDPQPGTLDAKAQGCLCGFTDIGDGETGPRVVASIRWDCPVHGERDPLGLGRICTICGVTPVGSKDPATDFCRGCYYSGAMDERELNKLPRRLLDRLRAIDGVYKANVWQTGGGCMVLAIELLTGEFISAADEDPVMPPAEGPWHLIIAETVDAWHEWEEDRLDLVGMIGDGTDNALVGDVAARAARARAEFDAHGCSHPDDDHVETTGRCARCGGAWTL